MYILVLYKYCTFILFPLITDMSALLRRYSSSSVSKRSFISKLTKFFMLSLLFSICRGSPARSRTIFGPSTIAKFSGVIRVSKVSGYSWVQDQDRVFNIVTALALVRLLYVETETMVLLFRESLPVHQ